MSDTPTICDRCGLRRRLCDVRKEWTGLVVCPACWDPKPAELGRPRIGPEGRPKRNARPQPEPVFIDPTQPIDPDSFAPSSGIYVP